MKSPARKRLRRRWPLVFVVVVLGLLVLADRGGWLLVPAADDFAAYHGVTVAVIRIIDGDTIEIELPDTMSGEASTRVRLWGIDTPELGRPGVAPEPLAHEARDLVRSLIAQEPVLLRLERHPTRDSYGRLLAHVELPDGRLLNDELLRAGLAEILDRWPHSRMVQYERAELIARRAKRGLWSK